jgi:hypothetical protein
MPSYQNCHDCAASCKSQNCHSCGGVCGMPMKAQNSRKKGKKRTGKCKTMKTAYCVSCKRKRSIKGAQMVAMKGGGKRLKGKCGTCGSNVSVICKGPSKKRKN